MDETDNAILEIVRAWNQREKYMIEQGLADLLHAYEDRKRAHKRRVARFN